MYADAPAPSPWIEFIRVLPRIFEAGIVGFPAFVAAVLSYLGWRKTQKVETAVEVSHAVMTEDIAARKRGDSTRATSVVSSIFDQVAQIRRHIAELQDHLNSALDSPDSAEIARQLTIEMSQNRTTIAQLEAAIKSSLMALGVQGAEHWPHRVPEPEAPPEPEVTP